MTSKRSFIALAALAFALGGCSSASTASSDKSSNGDDDGKKKHKKSKGDDDDDDDDKKAKKKKDKGDDDQGDLAPVASASDDTTADQGTKKPGASASDSDGRDNGDAGPPPVSSLPTPASCAPDAKGKLGASPKLLANAAAPGASIAVWGKANQSPLSDLAITISADSRCYVEYKTINGPKEADSFEGVTLSGGANGAHAISGIATNSTAETVTFRVQWSVLFHQSGVAQKEDHIRFYGYVHSSPYPCTAIPNEKECAMYQTALAAPIAKACVPTAKGGGPTVIVSPPKPKPTTTVTIAAPTTKPTIAAPTLPTAKPDAGAGDAGDANAAACDALACTTNAGFWKDTTNHVFAAFSAGKPKACGVWPNGPKPGETWAFDGSAWVKH